MTDSPNTTAAPDAEPDMLSIEDAEISDGLLSLLVHTRTAQLLTEGLKRGLNRAEFEFDSGCISNVLTKLEIEIEEFHRKIVGEDFAFRELAKEEFARARALGLPGR
jgi:hypothetical protein